jgi:hypothetical protein
LAGAAQVLQVCNAHIHASEDVPCRLFIYNCFLCPNRHAIRKRKKGARASSKPGASQHEKYELSEKVDFSPFVKFY